MELPEPALQKALFRRYAEIVTALSLEPGEQPLVLPNGEWFPDAFRGDRASLEGLVARMQGYAGLEGTELEIALLDAEGESCETSGCGTGSCAKPPAAPGSSSEPRLVALGSGFRLELPASVFRSPIALTAGVARLLGGARLALAEWKALDAASAELAATALGFGVLLLEGSYLYSKSCGGPSVGSVTVLSCGELALPFALTLARDGHPLGPARAELATTQRAVVGEAWALVRSNPKLVELVKRDPARIARGDFQLRESGSWLSRWFGGREESAPRDPASLALAALERGDSVESVAALLDDERPAPAPRPEGARASAEGGRRRQRDDVADLVDEALAELRAREASAGE